MSNNAAQPFAPTSAEVQYEAPHGLLKLRGGHDQPGTSAYPELDEKGVSTFPPSWRGRAMECHLRLRVVNETCNVIPRCNSSVPTNSSKAPTRLMHYL
jgi:hypothetical protein